MSVVSTYQDRSSSQPRRLIERADDLGWCKRQRGADTNRLLTNQGDRKAMVTGFQTSYPMLCPAYHFITITRFERDRMEGTIAAKTSAFKGVRHD